MPLYRNGCYVNKDDTKTDHCYDGCAFKDRVTQRSRSRSHLFRRENSL